jgi:hypothetical protein
MIGGRRRNDLFPSVVTAIGFHQPGKLVGHGMALIERHKAALDLDRFLVIVDRAYDNGRVETFHIPARKAGVELVIDYKTKDLGLQGHYEDLILVDGNWPAGIDHQLHSLDFALRSELPTLASHNEHSLFRGVHQTGSRPDVLTEAFVLRLQPFDLGVFDRGHPVAGAVVDIGRQHPPAHSFVADTDLTRATAADAAVRDGYSDRC